MPPRMATRKRPLEQPENPRPTKRVATTLASSSTRPQSAGNVENDKSSVLSKVDTTVSRYLYEYCLERDAFDKLQPQTKPRILRDIFRLIVVRSGEMLNPNLHEMVADAEYSQKWAAFVQAHPDLVDVLLECWALNPPSFNRVLQLEYLQKPKPQPATAKERLSRCKDTRAMLSSWSEEFRGGSAKLLHNTLRSYLKNDTGCIPYARYAALLQSTGTGKSRMNDELAKSIVYIPVNLAVQGRNPTRGICPPPDNQKFQDWFWRNTHKNPTQQILREHYEGFVFGLVTTTKNRLEKIQDADKTIPGKSALSSATCVKSATLDRLSILAKQFRAQMSAMKLNDVDEPVLEYGECRERFYTDVMAEAEKFSAGLGKPVDVENAGNALRDFLDPQRLCAEEPLLVICFDDANSLTCSIERRLSYTHFSELRRALHPLNNLPFFSLFVSTGGQLQEISPDSYTFDPSNRVQIEVVNLFAPITEVGFDEFAERVPADGSWRLDQIASTHYIAHLGRALFPTRYDNSLPRDRIGIVDFARGRLLGYRFSTSSMPWPEFKDDKKLACLDVRLCLEFRGSHWIDRSEECNQMDRHMRLCVSATRGFKEMFTVAPSEPLLAEAASLGMGRWGAAKTLLTHIRTSHLDAGARGELVVALLALLARDNALRKLKPPLDPPNVSKLKNNSKYAEHLKADGAQRVVRVIDFLEALLPQSCHEQLENHTPSECFTPDASTNTLEETFRHAHIWFNHFVKVHDFNGAHDHLWQFLVRGAAVICTNNGSINMLIPILFNNRLCEANVSAILIQVRNDPSDKADIRFGVFENMNPFGSGGIFSEKVTAPRPVIRMVFALASDRPSVEFGPSASCSSAPSRLKKKSKPKTVTSSTSAWAPGQSHKPRFTGFDVWCAGASSQIFRVIDPNDDHVYRELLERTRDNYDPYTDTFGSVQDMDDRATARRAMHRGAQSMLGHH